MKKEKLNSSSLMKLSSSEGIPGGGRPVRKVHPLGMRVLVQIKKSDAKTDGGLYLPESAKGTGEESLLAKVIEVASALDDETDEETNISGVPLGATVLIGRSSGVKVPWDESLRIVETKEVLALVDEVELI